jgi:alpha-L-rhamnosidase
VDWPVTTRDGYDVSAKNSEDTVRSSFGAMALSALADVAGWLGKPGPAARYGAMAAATRAALARHNLRRNGSEAFFVDGAVGASAAHAAVHSTLFAAAAGAADGDAALGDALAAWLQRHGVAPSSCMMGRWWVTALLRLGVWSAAAADAALGVLTAEQYPGWINMMQLGATTTMEAWRPEDKSNLDY